MMRHFLLLAAAAAAAAAQGLPSCPSRVFCQGELLHTVQMAEIYNDSKTFVDMMMVHPEAETLAAFERLQNATGRRPDRAHILQFVQAYFRPEDALEPWTPPDWTPAPPILQRIADGRARAFAQRLVNIWPLLARKMGAAALERPDRSTLIPVANGFIVPGGRFREFYYWDSFWIVRGLLLSGMHATVRGMLDNFLSIVDRYGFVPNGARIYYLNRSQPPFLAMMVHAYVEATGDTAMVKRSLPALEREARFWAANRTVEVVDARGRKFRVARFAVDSPSPRPESYAEDVNTASAFADEAQRRRLYASLKSGAESGWDFSSRWIFDEAGGNTGDIRRLDAQRVAPVDLNAYLCRTFALLAQLHALAGGAGAARGWGRRAARCQRTVDELFYDAADGIWYDFDIELRRPRRFFYPSNFAPLWTRTYDAARAAQYGRAATKYFYRMNLDAFRGGVPTSLEHNGEQWDYPNAWAPLQYLIVFGLEGTGEPSAAALAERLARTWVNATLVGFQQTNEMFEKYDAEVPGRFGGGGEYVVQSGFGWTNGAVLDFINFYYTKPVPEAGRSA